MSEIHPKAFALFALSEECSFFASISKTYETHYRTLLVVTVYLHDPLLDRWFRFIVIRFALQMEWSRQQRIVKETKKEHYSNPVYGTFKRQRGFITSEVLSRCCISRFCFFSVPLKSRRLLAIDQQLMNTLPGRVIQLFVSEINENFCSKEFSSSFSLFHSACFYDEQQEHSQATGSFLHTWANQL
jgi:hypothetical protein